MPIPDLSYEAAAGIITLATLQLYGTYKDAAPSLANLRDAAPTDSDTFNKLRDADIMVGGLVLFIAVAFYVLAKRVSPGIMLLIGFLAISGWHHMVRRAA